MSIRRMLIATAAISALMLGSSPTLSSDYSITDVEVVPGSPYDMLHVSVPAPFNPISGLILLTTPTGTIPVFCVDLYHTIDIGPVGLTYRTAPVATDSSGIDSGTGNPLTAAQADEIQALANRGVTDYSHAPDADEVAVQGAIWRIEYPTASVNSSDGSIESMIGSDVIWAEANPAAYSAGLYPAGASTDLFGTTQGFVVGSPIPEPSTWVLMTLGFGLLAYPFRRRNQAPIG